MAKKEVLLDLEKKAQETAEIIQKEVSHKIKDRDIRRSLMKKGGSAAHKILDNLIAKASNPDDFDMEAAKLIVNKFFSKRWDHLIYLPQLPRLNTIDDIEKAEIMAFEMVADEIITFDEAEKLMQACKLRRYTIESKVLINEVNIISEYMERSENSNNLTHKTMIELINEIVARRGSVTDEEKMYVLKSVKEAFIKA